MRLTKQGHSQVSRVCLEVHSFDTTSNSYRYSDMIILHKNTEN